MRLLGLAKVGADRQVVTPTPAWMLEPGTSSLAEG
jgi:hypothetical protein